VDDAWAWCESLRLVARALSPAGGPHVSLSIGLTTSHPGGSATDAMHAADMALLAAKGAGRDAVRVAAK
jgi:PleD family two-component response regulator